MKRGYLEVIASIVIFFLVNSLYARTCGSDNQRTWVFEGDSLTYGLDSVSSNALPGINGANQRRNIKPFPEEVGAISRAQIQIVNRGFPGDRSIDGLMRWRNERGGDAFFLMYGTNDAFNFGLLQGGPIDTESYMVALSRLALRRMSEGGHVFILTPPPIRDTVSDRFLEPYREAAVMVAKSVGIPLLATDAVLVRGIDWWTDGIHLNSAANAALAKAVLDLACFRIASAAPA